MPRACEATWFTKRTLGNWSFRDCIKCKHNALQEVCNGTDVIYCKPFCWRLASAWPLYGLKNPFPDCSKGRAVDKKNRKLSENPDWPSSKLRGGKIHGKNGHSKNVNPLDRQRTVAEVSEKSHFKKKECWHWQVLLLYLRSVHIQMLMTFTLSQKYLIANHWMPHLSKLSQF